MSWIGPNAAGKSCYLKQVALITFLGHVGCFVPADECTLGITDRIFSRVCSIQDGCEPENVKLSPSTFAIDITQIALMMSLASPRSLLIIDEFGKVHAEHYCVNWYKQLFFVFCTFIMKVLLPAKICNKPDPGLAYCIECALRCISTMESNQQDKLKISNMFQAGLIWGDCH